MRQARIKVAGVPWHVTQRGHNRDACFFVPDDYVFYLNHLTRLSGMHGCAIHEDSVSLMMKKLAQLATQRCNQTRDRSGALWNGRFHSNIVETTDYLLRCYRYVELNPVRAGLVRHPGDYPWSSYRANAAGDFSPAIQPHPEFLALGSCEPSRRRAYSELLDQPIPEVELAFLRERMRSGFVIGSPSFEREIGQVAGRAAGPIRRRLGSK